MARPQRFLVDPNNPQSIVEQSTEHTKVLEGEVSFGDPSDPNDLNAVTPLAGDAAASHPGVLQNMEGSWAEALVEDADTPVMFNHNLDLPISQIAGFNSPNVRWLHFMWQHTGLVTAPSLSNPSLVSWKLIRDHTVTGAAVGSITFTGLDGNTDEHYKIVHNITLNSAAAALDFLIQPNSATTTYQTQFLRASNAAVTAGAGATAGFVFAKKFLGAAGDQLVGETTAFVKANGEQRMSKSMSTALQGNMAHDSMQSRWTNVSSNVTSLKFLDSGAGTEFGVGTRIMIWAPQDQTEMTRDATVSYCYDSRDRALITKDAFPLRFYFGGNRGVNSLEAMKATFFFIPAIR